MSVGDIITKPGNVQCTVVSIHVVFNCFLSDLPPHLS